MKRNKKGAWKTSSIVLAAIGASLAVILVFGSIALMFVFFRYMRSDNSSAQITTEPTTKATEQIQPTLPSDTSESATETTSDSTDKHFSVTDAATLPDKDGKTALSVAEIASEVSPATVSIRGEVAYSDYFGQNGTAESSGSGFIVSADGYIVTNNHVVAGASKIQVLIPGEKDYIDATVVGTDTSTDVAVLKVDKTDLPYVTLGDSDELQVGELAVAIGNPFGELAGTVTAGVISALDRQVTIEGSSYNLLQTDASINSGNSGGPLVNSYGEVIGITNAKVSEGEGIGFAIPINDIKTVIEDLINKGYVSGRPVMGVGVVTVDETTSETYGWPTGAYVREVTAGGAAEKAGIKVGDIIVAIDGTAVTTADEVSTIKNKHSVGDVLTVTISRNNEKQDLKLTLEEATS